MYLLPDHADAVIKFILFLIMSVNICPLGMAALAYACSCSKDTIKNGYKLGWIFNIFLFGMFLLTIITMWIASLFGG